MSPHWFWDGMGGVGVAVIPGVGVGGGVPAGVGVTVGVR